MTAYDRFTLACELLQPFNQQTPHIVRTSCNYYNKHVTKEISTHASRAQRQQRWEAKSIRSHFIEIALHDACSSCAEGDLQLGPGGCATRIKCMNRATRAR
uniref:Uncharacterized protein n=1 Tax=Physcomitrium patens TaxID=3218 RepID=A0A2K1IVF5_PHYPA|nr:hypothetical protein PHYPA_025199 [Physcomitrium patens]